MRHINQMTREELIKKINEVDDARRAANGIDSILYTELYNLGRVLDDEATRRANSTPVGATAAAYGVVL